MAFTEHRYAANEIAALAAKKYETLKKNKGFSDFLGFANGVIAKRLERDLTSYRQYGPWWWGLKDVLRRSGRDYGSVADPVVREAYSFAGDAETLVAADAFRDWYLSTQFLGTARFYLDQNSGDHYDLWDDDMELGA